MIGVLSSWVLAVIVAGAVFLVVGVVNFIIDPYQKYRRPTRYRTYYSRPRHLNPGLARHHDYDIALVGASQTGSISPSMVESEMGGTCIKLPVYGASARELRMTLEAVLAAGKAKTIIFPLTHYILKAPWDRLPFTHRAVPYQIYRDHPGAHLRYLLGFDTLAQGIKVLRKNRKCRRQERFDPDRYGWHPDDNEYGAKIAVGKWRKKDPLLVKDPSEHSFAHLKKCYDENLLPVIRSTEGIRFLLFFPAFSILAWADDEADGIAENVFKVQQHVVESLTDLENVEIFDFQARDWITDFDNFSDAYHFRPERAKELLHDLHAGVGRVTVTDPSEAPARIRKLLKDFDLPVR